MKNFRSLVRVLCATLPLAIGLIFTYAQTSIAADSLSSPAVSPSPQAVTNPTKPAHESDGLVFAINSIHVNNNSLFIQYAVKNTTKVRQYIILYGSGGASTDNGGVGMVNSFSATGISHCFMQNGFDADMLKACKNPNDSRNSNGGGANIENYTYIDPGDLADASITYGFVNASTLDQAKTASFKFMALVRTARDSADPLAGSDAAKDATQPKTVNVTFPFVPIHNGE